MGGPAWHARRDRVRKAFNDQIEAKSIAQELAELTGAMDDLEARASSGTPTPPAPTGAAAGPAASGAAPSAPMAGASASPASFATSATATGPTAGSMPAGRPTSGTSAPSTSSPSSASTVWQASPLGFVERNLKPQLAGPNGVPPGLPARVLSSLRTLATGRAETVADTIQAIAEFYVEQEDERAEGTLADALTHYVDNQLI